MTLFWNNMCIVTLTKVGIITRWKLRWKDLFHEENISQFLIDIAIEMTQTNIFSS